MIYLSFVAIIASYMPQGEYVMKHQIQRVKDKFTTPCYLLWISCFSMHSCCTWHIAIQLHGINKSLDKHAMWTIIRLHMFKHHNNCFIINYHCYPSMCVMAIFCAISRSGLPCSTCALQPQAFRYINSAVLSIQKESSSPVQASPGQSSDCIQPMRYYVIKVLRPSIRWLY